MNLSHTTKRPASSAGRMRSSIWSARAAAKNRASASAPKCSAAPERRICRIASAPGEPPGSRVSSTSQPHARKWDASNLAWVDFPVPSPPSSVMNRPANLFMISECRGRSLGTGAQKCSSAPKSIIPLGNKRAAFQWQSSPNSCYAKRLSARPETDRYRLNVQILQRAASKPDWPE